MAKRLLPNSKAAVFRTLNAVRDAWKQFPQNRLITANQWAQVDDALPDSLLHRLTRKTAEVRLALASQIPLSRDLRTAIDHLALLVSHFHQVYDLGVTRGDFTAAGRAYYGREITAKSLPDLSTITAALEAGAKIITGEAARAEAEGPAHIPMALPSAARIAAAHALATARHNAAQTAKLRTDTAQNEVTALHPQARALAVSLIKTIDFQLSERTDLDAPGRRHIARAWGLTYTRDKENPEPEPAP